MIRRAGCASGTRSSVINIVACTDNRLGVSSAVDIVNGLDTVLVSCPDYRNIAGNRDRARSANK